ncbi:MAG: anti-sigma factor [Beijerinckiaceae bacterium]|jgi:anti-sigma-K factor RskA|nr:anti-sigma factor [Beijerinckiaceae bacterium]
MTRLSDELEALAGEYALGTLEATDRSRAEALAATNPAFREALIAWQLRLAPLDDTASPMVPLPTLWSRIESLIPLHDPKSARGARPSRLTALWESLGFWRPLGLASGLAGLVLAVALAMTIARGPLKPEYVAVLNTGDGRAAAVVNVYADGTVNLIPLEDIAVPQGRIIEVWTLQRREQGPVSVGRLDRARSLKLDLKNLGKPEANHLFELTLEPRGGSPTGKPTGPILMKGLAARSI